MRRKVNKVICYGCAVGVLAATAGIIAGAVSSTQALIPLDKNDFLKTDGRAIINAKGQPVILRGVNLGGWLLQESQMSPNNGEDKAWGCYDTLETLIGRFGEEKANELINTFLDNWITSSDIKYLKKLGVNCVRVPFWYRNLQSDDKGTWIKNKDGEIDFSRLDWIIKECGKRGIYVILDMHGAPGFQSNGHLCGKVNSSELFDCSLTGLKYRCRTTELWKEIAKHFKGNPAIAAFDLLNEPMSGFTEDNKNDEQLWRFYNKLYNTVRIADPNRMITVEGIWDMQNLPDPKKFCWKNIVYQLHVYNWTTPEIDRKTADINDRANWNVPVLVGELQTGGLWDYTLSTFNENGLSWLTRNYKGFNTSKSDWLFTGEIEAANLQEDSFEQMKVKWGKPCKTSVSFTENTELANTMKKHLIGYVEKADEVKETPAQQSNPQEKRISAVSETTAEIPQTGSENKPENITSVFGTAMLVGMGTLGELQKKKEETSGNPL